VSRRCIFASVLWNFCGQFRTVFDSLYSKWQIKFFNNFAIPTRSSCWRGDSCARKYVLYGLYKSRVALTRPNRSRGNFSISDFFVVCERATERSDLQGSDIDRMECPSTSINHFSLWQSLPRRNKVTMDIFPPPVYGYTFLQCVSY